MQQTDADGANALHTKIPRRLTNGRLIERSQFLTAEIQPSGDFANELQRYDAVGLHPEIGVAITLRHRLPGDFENMFEAAIDDQPQRIDLALQQRVGRDGRSVSQPHDIIGGCTRGGENFIDAAQQADRRIRRRARDLGHVRGSRQRINRNDVGEGSAGIDADAIARGNR